MNGRIDDLVGRLRARSATGLAAYLVAGDPDPGTTLRAMRALVGAGVSMLEVGIPFSDPVADGPVVAEGHMRALRGGATVERTLELVSRFREGDDRTPVVAMGYANPILARGMERFFRDAALSGIDGAIVVDLPLEQAAPWRDAARDHGVGLVPLWAPTASRGREERILSSSPGLVYMVTRAGTTGRGAFVPEEVRERAGRARRGFATGVAAGFGVGTPSQARELRGAVDLVVVGSRLVDALGSGSASGVDRAVRTAREFVDALA